MGAGAFSVTANLPQNSGFWFCQRPEFFCSDSVDF